MKAKKILSIFLSVSLMASALGTGAAVSAATQLPVKDGNYVAATDYSVLTPGSYKDEVKWVGDLDTTTEIFTKGILIDTGNFGNGAGTANFHGFKAYDDGTGKTEFIEAQAFDNTGMRFTLGLNAGGNYAGAAAFAIKVDNVNIPEEWVGAVQGWTPKLICSDGTEYTLKDYSTSSASLVTYFLNTADNSITTRQYNREYTNMLKGRVAGWIVFPLNLFEGTVDATKVTQVALELGSYWNVQSRIYEMGFVTDINKFLGIIEPLESSQYLTMATDFSGLTPSEEAYRDVVTNNNNDNDCVLDTESKLFTGGYMVDDSSSIGVGAGKTNFHGFYARDIDDDGGTDYLEAYPRDDQGMRFTLGMTEEPEVSGEAIAIHIGQNIASHLTEWPLGIDFTLNTADGPIGTIPAANAPSSLNYYFYNAKNGDVTTFNYRSEGWVHLAPLFPEGWLIIPTAMFASEVDTSMIASIKFWLSSQWNANIRIYGVGYATDMYKLLGIERPKTPISESEYLTAVNDYSKLVLSNGENSNNYNDASTGWECELPTDTALFTNGIVVDTENFGVGADKSNFHGFYARDLDGDNIADTLEAFPYSDGGMRFTLGMNGTPVSDGEGIAIHFSYIDNGSSWSDSTIIAAMLTLNTKNGSYALNRTASKAAYFVDNATHAVELKNLGYTTGLVNAKKDGWLVIPISAFGALNTGDIKSIAFDLASTWSYNLRISEISVVSDINALVGATLGDIDRNGAVDAGDTVIMRKLLLGSEVGNVDSNVADVKADGKLDLLDFIRLKKELAA